SGPHGVEKSTSSSSVIRAARSLRRVTRAFGVTYLIWAIGVGGLFFACRAYGAFRSGAPTRSIRRAL
ncbi:MAG: hypothetical protein MI724_14530, partial [Spirochaetales bacterium]|nr:hypothetical protein [Spirochaetales bacterium]